MRAGEWKLFNTGELYHLGNDLGEKKNVAGANPGVDGPEGFRPTLPIPR